jgi:hypothetical protein
MGHREVRPKLLAAGVLAFGAWGCGSGEVDNVVVTLKGQVVDAGTQVAPSSALVTLYDDTGAWLGEVEADDDGVFKATIGVPYDTADGVTIRATVVGPFVDTEFRQQFFLRDPGSSELSLEPSHRIDPVNVYIGTVLVARNTSRTGTIRGRVFDVLERDMAVGLGATPLLLRAGVNPDPDGPIVASTVTSGAGAAEDADSGNFVFEDLPAGTYTVFIDGGAVPGTPYLDASFQVAVVGGEDRGGQNGGTTVAIEDNQARAVLTWGDSPVDLDMHVTGDVGSGLGAVVEEDRFHVYWDVPVYPQDAGPDTAEVLLDVDDVSGYGPETVTVLHRESGLYRFSVHDNINKLEQAASVLSFSGARMQLWVGRDTYASFDVPVNEPGTVWQAVEVDGETGHFFPVGAMSFEAEPGNGGAF